MNTINPFLIFLFSFLLVMVAGCEAQVNKSNTKTPPAASKAPHHYKEGSDYILFERVRMLDRTAFSKPEEAYSILLPKGWKYQNDIIWNQPGSSCPGTFNWIKATAADGTFSFEMIPDVLYSWSSNPETLQFFQNNSGATSFCSMGKPMNAEQYLRNVFAPNELGSPEIIKVEANRFVTEEMQQSNDKTRMEVMQYGSSQIQFYQSAINARVRWKDGTEGLVVLGVNNIENTVPNMYNGTSDVMYTMQVYKRTVFKYRAAESQQASRLFSMIMGSFRSNPAWTQTVNTFWKDVRQKKHIAHLGTLKMLDAQTRAIGDAAIKSGNERLKAMDNDMRSWEQRQSEQDRMHTNFIKTIREVENYRDETGKVELSSAYNHAWSRSDGTSFVMSNDPNFDASSVFKDQRWKEMRKVD